MSDTVAAPEPGSIQYALNVRNRRIAELREALAAEYASAVDDPEAYESSSVLEEAPIGILAYYSVASFKFGLDGSLNLTLSIPREFVPQALDARYYSDKPVAVTIQPVFISQPDDDSYEAGNRRSNNNEQVEFT